MSIVSLARSYWLIFLIFVLFFLLRLTNLAMLPPFNDESIYLHWGWREIHTPGEMYYSLYAGNQPLLMWLFGISASLTPNPIFAARVVSALTGFLSLIGIYCLGKSYVSKSTAILACFIYSITPIFVFFDRQILLESAISAVGVWACYLSIKLIRSQKVIYALALGVIFGIGYFIKSSSLIFILTFLGVYLYMFLLNTSNWKINIRNSVSIVITFLIVDYSLLKQPLFWETYTMMSQNHILSIQELLHFPFSVWMKTIQDVFEIGFWQVTPYFLVGIIGVVVFITSSRKEQKYMGHWFLLPIVFLVVFSRNVTPRYLMPFLPLSALFSSYILLRMVKKQRFIDFFSLTISLILPFWLTSLIIFSPLNYFFVLSGVTKFSQKNEYVIEWPSGYGVQQACDYMKKQTENKTLYVGVRGDMGNPEDGVFNCFAKSKFIKAVYFDSGNFRKKVSSPCVKDYVSIQVPDYFISRDMQLGGLDNFLEEVVRFYKPENKSFIGVYKVKSCENI